MIYLHQLSWTKEHTHAQGALVHILLQVSHLCEAGQLSPRDKLGGRMCPMDVFLGIKGAWVGWELA
jgi:hypothetical protein